MSSVNQLSLPVHFKPNEMCHDKDFYQKADDAFCSCTCRIDSADEAKQRLSIVATNIIEFVAKELICKPLNETLNFSSSARCDGSSCDPVIAEKGRKLVQQLFSRYQEDFGTSDSPEQHKEWKKRSCNMLRLYFRSEALFLGTFMGQIKILTTRDAVAHPPVRRMLYSMRPGSLAEVIAQESERLFKESVSVKSKK